MILWNFFKNFWRLVLTFNASSYVPLMVDFAINFYAMRETNFSNSRVVHTLDGWDYNWLKPKQHLTVPNTTVSY